MKSLFRAVVVIAALSFAIACDDYHYRFFGAVDPSPVPVRPILTNAFGSFSANSTVIGVNGSHACVLPVAAGQTRANVPWRITVGAGSILFEQDTASASNDRASFSGVLNGQDFSAASSTGGTGLSSCIFRGGKLSGRFSADFSTFEASELLTWGQPGGETSLQRNWAGSRVGN